MKEFLPIVLTTFLVIGMLFCITPVVYADDGAKANPDAVIDVSISGGDVKVDISVSGPSELNVEAKGPAQVSIDAGDEVKLDVKAGDESQVFIKGQGVDEPARQPETGYDKPAVALDNGSLKLNEPVVSSGNQVTIMLAAFAIAAGLVAFFLIGRFVYRNRSERKIK